MKTLGTIADFLEDCEALPGRRPQMLVLPVAGESRKFFAVICNTLTLPMRVAYVCVTVDDTRVFTTISRRGVRVLYGTAPVPREIATTEKGDWQTVVNLPLLRLKRVETFSIHLSVGETRIQLPIYSTRAERARLN